jgi:hypothetical protein
MKVKILVAGAYNGLNGKNVDCAEGDELETREWYGVKLVERGVAEAIEPTLTPNLLRDPETKKHVSGEGGKAKAKTAADKKKAGPAGPVTTTNVFLG